MDIKNKKISEGDFHALRNEILTQWPTGKDVNLQEAIDTIEWIIGKVLEGE